MQRKVMVACVGVAAVLIFARFFGSGARAGWDEGAAFTNAYSSRPAVVPLAAAPPVAALPAVAAQAAAMAGVTPPAVGAGAAAAPATPASDTSPARPAAPAGPDLPATAGPAGLIAPTPTTARPRPTSTRETRVLRAPTEAPTATSMPTETPTQAPAPPQSEPAASEGPSLNGVPLDGIVVLSPGVGDHVREIFARGQALGRNPRAFSKVGDSTMAWPPFLAAFDERGAYQLGPYDYLAPTIERFARSFGRSSAAVKKGMHSWTEFDPAWVNSNACRRGEGPLACELRLNNPGIAFIRLGANDYNQPNDYRDSLRKIVEQALAQGVIPVLGTKPDRLEGPQNTINEIVYQMAADYRLPVWDYDRIAATVPGKGLMSDGTHFLDGGSHDYSSSAAFQAADSLEDLTALMMLEALGREIEGGR